MAVASRGDVFPIWCTCARDSGAEIWGQHGTTWIGKTLTWWGANLPFDHVDVCTRTFTNKNDGMMLCAALISTPMSSVLDLHQ